MKYYYEKPKTWSKNIGEVVTVNHPLFNRCTVFQKYGIGIMVVQQRFNPITKVKWYGPIDDWIASDIYLNPGFENYLNEYGTLVDENGLFYIITVRKLMWALRMKPLPKEFWEEDP